MLTKVNEFKTEPWTVVDIKIDGPEGYLQELTSLELNNGTRFNITDTWTWLLFCRKILKQIFFNENVFIQIQILQKNISNDPFTINLHSFI